MPKPLEAVQSSLQSRNESQTNPHRIRHVTAIQVRNLTPFPIRDAFASALTQPSEQPQFSAQGHLSDDLDVTLSKKRARRISSASANTLRSTRPDIEGTSGDSGTLGRKRTSSKSGLPNSSVASTTPGPARRPSILAGPPVSRQSHRTRTSSVSSIISNHSHSLPSSSSVADMSTSTIPSFLRDTSQTGLEEVLKSRLVETFITITILPNSSCQYGASQPQGHKSNPGSPSVSRSATPSTGSAPGKERLTPPINKTESRRNTITNVSNNTRPRSSTLSKRGGHATSSSLSRVGTSGQFKPAPILNGRTPRSPGATISQKQRPSTPPSTPPTPDHSTAKFSTPSPPDYLSPIHRPSTNPCFILNARAGYEFAPGSELSGAQMRVEVWGRMGSGWTRDIIKSKAGVQGSLKGKGKEVEIDMVKVKVTSKANRDDEKQEWDVLQKWDVNMDDLLPLPEDLANHPSHLPSNTLLITLSPPGQVFYLPHSHLQSPGTRSPTPTGPHSDPESEVRKVTSAGELMPGQARRGVESLAADEQDVHDFHEPHSPRMKGIRLTASSHDLVKLIDLQTCVQDMQQSLPDVIRESDRMISGDGTNALTREVSERAAWVAQLVKEMEAVNLESDERKHRIAARRAELKRRREMLALARRAHEEDAQITSEGEEDVTEARSQLATLESQFAPTRSVLINSLAFIYPIELVSPPDLLFTILDVPLPIPLSSTDPAPPLTLPAHRGVTEDAVATALGYAAQVVQLLAAYLGKGLVYPVTCVGSRSLIKDGISAMVGPKMFPLFSKGVDTYRFEYGVFLLNKDIEMLMADRNLRALDMRHTLPNMKNLLLTLTDCESTRLPVRPPSISDSSLLTLESPVIKPTETAEEPPQANGIDIDTSVAADVEPSSPPASGATTPTTPTLASRKSRAFIDLTPLAGFWRGRYPSRSRAPTESEAEGSGTDANGDAAGIASGSSDDEDDRRTIRPGTAEDAEAKEPLHLNGDANTNGSAVGEEAREAEKAQTEREGLHSPRTVTVV